MSIASQGVITEEAESGRVEWVELSKLTFDLWRNDWWIGMATGDTVQEARLMVVDAGYPADHEIIMTPFYGLNTSKETYVAITGRKAK